MSDALCWRFDSIIKYLITLNERCINMTGRMFITCREPWHNFKPLSDHSLTMSANVVQKPVFPYKTLPAVSGDFEFHVNRNVYDCSIVFLPSFKQHTHTHTHTHTHSQCFGVWEQLGVRCLAQGHTCWFCYTCEDFHRLLLFLYWPNNILYCPTPTLPLNLTLTGDILHFYILR